MITKKERNLIVGAIKRVFSRSELRRHVLENATVEHSDPKRPRVKKWAICAICTLIVPRYLMDVDHLEPRIPLDKTTDDLTIQEIIDRTWCNILNLQAVCQQCHDVKTSSEKKIRAANRKERKNKARQESKDKA